jgi:lantibiotic biosynthesis protein
MDRDYLAAADRIGARLARDAIWHEDRCNWFAPYFESATGSKEQGLVTLGPTIYDGTAGIALFLAELHRLTADPVFAATARGAIAHALSRRDDVIAPMRQGFHTGAVGIGYAAAVVGTCLGDDGLAARGAELALQAFDPSTMMLDVISGGAGSIPALLRLAQLRGDPRLAEAAWAAGEAILARAAPSERGLSWDTMGEMAEALEAAGLGGQLARTPAHPNLTGLSHGAGGIGLALLELAAATGEARFGAAARRAFGYEDSWFDAANDEWPDLRRDPATGGDAPAPSAWCHGAAGIGLARLRAFELTGDDGFREDALRALRIAGRSIGARLAAGEANYSLCHGVAGDAELFLLASEALGLPQGLEVARGVAGYGLAEFAETGAPWPSGAPGGAETPGLMLGLAGTGYFYLRMSAPTRVPPILVLSRPCTQPVGEPVA